MQTTKLESRQDVLDLLVSKGASFNNERIKKIDDESKDGIDDFSLRHNTVGGYGGGGVFVRNIYEILYSPESNFFEVINSVCDKENKKFLNIMKVLYVTSPDPLQYLISNLNGSTSS